MALVFDTMPRNLISSPIDIRSFYDRIAENYAMRECGNKKYFFNSMELQCLDGYCATPGRALDIGTGAGRVAAYLAARQQTVIGVDFSPAMLQQAKRNHPEPQILGFCQADHHALPFGDHEFDLITCFGCFETCNLLPVLSRLQLLLKPKGILVFTVYNANAWFYGKPGFPIDAYTRDDLENLLRITRFQIREMYTAFHVNGRWIWALHRCLSFSMGLSRTWISVLIQLNRRLQRAPRFRSRGRIHLVIAQA